MKSGLLREKTLPGCELREEYENSLKKGIILSVIFVSSFSFGFSWIQRIGFDMTDGGDNLRVIPPVLNDTILPKDFFGNSGNGVGNHGIGIGDGGKVLDDTIPSKPFIAVVDEEPVPVSIIAPVYPEIARRMGIEGTVYLQLYVDKDGKVKRVIVAKSSGSDILDESASKGANDWTFKPARQGERNVGVWIAYPVRFNVM